MTKATLWAIVFLLVGAVVVFGLFLIGSGADRTKVKTATVGRGDIENLVITTGTLDPKSMVEVGSEVSGMIKNIYVDYNSRVKKDQPLAELERATFEDAVEQNEANYRVASAELIKAKTAFDEAKKNFDRLSDLFNKKMVPEEDKDDAEAQYKTAQDDVKVAQDGMEEAKTELESSRVDLDHTVIRSPIDGIVFSRDVSVGQTVAARFETPVLFRIADDLSKMRVDVSVDEADVGKVKEGQKVRFSVEAFPEETFFGHVIQIRDEPDTSENVVTYTTLVEIENPDGKLMPGMTATVSIVTAEAKNVLKIPNSALRYRPAIGSGSGGKPAITSGIKPSPGGKATFVWVQGPKKKLTPVLIKTGITDSVYTEVLGGDLKEGDVIVTG